MEETDITENLLPVGQPIHLADSDRVFDILHVIAYENLNDTKHRSEILDQLMKVLLLKIHNSIYSEHTTAHYNELLNLRQRIYQHPEKQWTLASIAKELNLSPNYIHNLYKKSFHTTCNQDLITSRITAAKHQLVYTSKPVYLIASLVGYNDTEHFQRQFKKIEGISPLKYRKTHMA